MSISFPGYVPDVADLTDRIKAEQINALRDRAPQVFSSVANRTSALPSPVAGQLSIITTGSNAGEWIYYAGSTNAWCQPWNQPWGRVASGLSTNNQTISGATNVTGQTATWTALANRRYRTTLTAPYFQKNTLNGFVYARLVDASNAELTHTRVWLNVNEYGTASIVWEDTGLSAGSVTRRLRMEASASSIAVAGSSAPSSIIVEDIGPNGGP